MENYIKYNGVKLELTPEQVAALAAASAEPERKDPFERKIGSAYYYVDGDETYYTSDCGGEYDAKYYNTANYCRDEEMMHQRALRETLSRLLWRYSEQHGGDPEWDGVNRHWYVYKDEYCGKWKAFCNTTLHCSNSYFCSEEVANSAIEDVVKPFCAANPEFVW